MTPLNKPIHRETAKRIGSRAIIVTIAPAGSQAEAFIGVRLKGQRTQYVLALSDVYRIAALTYAGKAAVAKRQARKQGIPWRVAKRQFVQQNSIL